MLSLTRRLLAQRRGSPALSAGGYRPLGGADVPDDCFVYLREAGPERVLVALNFADGEKPLRLPDAAGELLVSTHLDREDWFDSRSLPLRAVEGCVIRLS